MKMNRKLFIALATLLLLGMLAGCKKKEKAEQKQEVATTVTTQTEAIPDASTETSTMTKDGFMMTGTMLTGYIWTNIEIIIIPDGVTRIRENTFADWTNLTSVTIPDSVTSIGSNAFSGTTWLNNQPDGVVYAGKVAYIYKGTMPANTSITLLDGTKEITGSAFSGCTNLTGITIPDSVITIGDKAFSGCESLTSVTIPNGVTSIGYEVFEDCTNLSSITVGDNNPNYSSLDGILYNKAKTEFIQVPRRITGNVTIPNGVTSIWGSSGGGVFSDCINLTNVTIPNSVTEIRERAFSDCTSLASVTIPNSVQEIWAHAFERCTSLTSVTFQGTITENNLSSSGMDSVRPPSPFNGDLKEKYLAGGIGTYTTTAPVKWDSKWTKQ